MGAQARACDALVVVPDLRRTSPARRAQQRLKRRARSCTVGSQVVVREQWHARRARDVVGAGRSRLGRQLASGSSVRCARQ